LSREFNREGLPMELVYADDLAWMASWQRLMSCWWRRFRNGKAVMLTRTEPPRTRT